MSAVFKLPTPMRELKKSSHLLGDRAALGDEVLVGTESDRVTIIRHVH
jgi:hypothetical protein